MVVCRISKYCTECGGQIRDWLHIDDLVAGIVYSIDNFPSGEPVELGSCEGTNFLHLASKMVAAYNHQMDKSKPVFSPVIAGDPSKATSSKFRVAGTIKDGSVSTGQRYGWAPKLSLDDGIALELGKMLTNR